MRSSHRFLLILFMLALLPLRGWAAEVMATEMASSQVVRVNSPTGLAAKSMANKLSMSRATDTLAVQKSTFEILQTKTPEMHDCEGHAAADSAASTDAHADACATCQACQACHSLALSVAVFSLNPTFASRTLPRSAAIPFSSATTALGQKPPIS